MKHCDRYCPSFSALLPKKGDWSERRRWFFQRKTFFPFTNFQNEMLVAILCNAYSGAFVPSTLLWAMRLFYEFSEKQHSPTFDLTLSRVPPFHISSQVEPLAHIWVSIPEWSCSSAFLSITSMLASNKIVFTDTGITVLINIPTSHKYFLKDWDTSCQWSFILALHLAGHLEITSSFQFSFSNQAVSNLNLYGVKALSSPSTNKRGAWSDPAWSKLIKKAKNKIWTDENSIKHFSNRIFFFIGPSKFTSP